MRDEVYKYLKFIRFKDVVQWDVKRYLEDSTISFNNAVRLKDILCPHYLHVSKEDMLDNNWSIIAKINFSGKLFLRDVSEVNTFKGNLNKIDSNTLIYSKINVKHGCIYYHPDNSTPFGVSSEYPAYKLDSKKVYGDYLVMIIQSGYFKNLLNQKTSGISKARVKPEEFLNIKIPLPTMAEQQALVKAYNEKVAESNKMELKARQIERDEDFYMLSELGIKPSGYPITESELPMASEPQVEYVVNRKQNTDLTDTYIWGNEIKQAYKYLRFVRFKDVGRWDCYNDISLEESSIYKNIKLSDVVASKPQYGASFSSKDYDGLIRYIRITDINEDGSLSDDKVSADGYSERYLLKENDFLIARSGNTVGKTFLYKEIVGKAIYAGYLIRFELNTNIIIPEYLLYYTKCSAYKHWVQSNMRVAAQPNINCQQYMDSPVVLPPINIQRSIVEHINKHKSQIKELKRQAETLRKEALEAFEKEIFE